MATRTLKIKGTFGPGNEKIQSFQFDCQTCFGAFDIQIPFSTGPGVAPTSTPLKAGIKDLGEASGANGKKGRKLKLTVKP